MPVTAIFQAKFLLLGFNRDRVGEGGPDLLLVDPRWGIRPLFIEGVFSNICQLRHFPTFP